VLYKHLLTHLQQITASEPTCRDEDPHLIEFIPVFPSFFKENLKINTD
jgi:hypothetical protein